MKDDKNSPATDEGKRLTNGYPRRDFIKKLGGIGVASLASSTSLGAGQKSSVENIPVILECAINGSTTRKKNPNAPETVKEQIAEMIRVLDAGAAIAHNHSNQFSEDPVEAARFYAEVNREVYKKRPYAITYQTVNLDLRVLRKERRALAPGSAFAHQRVLAKAGLTNMIMLDTGSLPVSLLEKDGIAKDAAFFVYQFWPEDVRFSQRTCADFGCGAAVAVYEPGWMKTVAAMARAGTLPRGSKINLFFGGDKFGCMAPPVPEALELYLKMMEGLDLNWTIGCPATDRSVMDTPLARMALERGGSLRVGLEDYTTGPSNLEQLERAKELVAAVGRQIIFGQEALEYLDIPAQPRPVNEGDFDSGPDPTFGATPVDPRLQFVC